jgi:hypothetical protein
MLYIPVTLDAACTDGISIWKMFEAEVDAREYIGCLGRTKIKHILSVPKKAYFLRYKCIYS